MEQEILNALSGFDAVWQRVVSGKDGTAPDIPAEEGPLERAMGLWETYTYFARRVRGPAGARFKTLAGETRFVVRALQTEHFLRTGDLYSPGAVGPMTAPGVLTGMQRAYNAERQLARQLSEHSALADTASRHAQVLRDMIAQLLNPET